MTNPDRRLEGGCACGAVRYQLLDSPMFVNNCHCRLCQRQTGTASAVNAFIESERLGQLSGELSEHQVRTGSGGIQTIVRCRECGTAVWSHYPRLGRAAAAVRVGTLNDPSALRIDAAIFITERPSWAPLPQDVPLFESTYRASEVLDPERLERVKALLPR